MSSSIMDELQLCFTEDEYNSIPINLMDKFTSLLKSKLEDITKLRELYFKKFIEGEKTSLELESSLREEKYSSLSNEEGLSKMNKKLENEIHQSQLLVDKLSCEKYELLSQVEICESESISSKYKMERLESEKKNLLSQMEYLQEELNRVNSDVLTSKQKYNNDYVQITIQMDEKNTENIMLRQHLESLQTKHDNLEATYKDCLERMTESSKVQSQLENIFHEELQAQKRLTEAYQSSTESLEEANDVLSSQLQQIKQQFTQNLQTYQQNQQNLTQEITNLEQNRQILETEVGNLKEQLSTANNLNSKIAISEEELSQLCPSAFASQNMIKSKNLTEIYSEYCQLTESLLKERNNNLRLSESISLLMQEAEDKAIQYKELKDENSRLIAVINKTDSSIENYHNMYEIEKSRADETVNKLERLKLQIGELKLQNKDLSLQVHILLKEIHEYRGGNVTEEEESDDLMSGLVRFKTIEELQTRNLQLLTIVRHLSKDSDDNEKEDLAEYEEKINQLTKANNEMSMLRERDSDLLDIVTKQRDLFHSMLSSENKNCMVIESVKPMDDTMSQSVVTESNEEIKYQEMKTKFEQYKRNQRENELILQGEIDTLREMNMKLKSSSVELSSQLEFQIMRFATVEKDIKMYQEDIEVMRRQYEDKRCHNVLLEDKLSQTNKELTSLRKDFEADKLRLVSANNNRESLMSSNNRLLAENGSLRAQQQAYSAIANDILYIKSAVDKNDEKIFFEKRINDLSIDLTTSRSNLAFLEQERQIERNKFTERIDELEKMLENLAGKLEENKGTIIKYQSEIASLRLRFGTEQEIGDIEAEMREEKMRMTKEIKMLRLEINATKSSLISSQQSQEEFKSLSAKYETVLHEQTQALSLMEEKHSREVERLTSELFGSDGDRQNLMTQLESLEAARQQNIKEINENKVELERLNNQLDYVRQESQRREEELVELLRRKDEIINEKNDCYQGEVRRHAEQIKQVETVKTELDSSLEMAADLLGQFNTARDTLTCVNSRSYEEKSRLLAAVKDLEGRNEELNRVNANLLQQLEQTVSLSSKKGIDDVAENDGNCSAEKLMEVINYLRKRKDLLSAQYELLLAENNRNMTNLEMANREIELGHRRIGELECAVEENSQRVGEYMRVRKELEELREVSRQNTRLSCRNSGLEDIIAKNKAEMETLRSSLGEKEMMVAQKLASIEALKNSNKQIVRENARWRTRVSQLVSENEELERLRIIEGELDKSREEVAKMEQKITDLEQENQKCDDLRKANADLQTTLREVKRLGKKYRDDCARLKEESQERLMSMMTEIESLNERNTELSALVEDLRSSNRTMLQKQTDLEALLEDRECRINILELGRESKRQRMEEEIQMEVYEGDKPEQDVHEEVEDVVDDVIIDDVVVDSVNDDVVVDNAEKPPLKKECPLRRVGDQWKRGKSFPRLKRF